MALPAVTVVTTVTRHSGLGLAQPKFSARPSASHTYDAPDPDAYITDSGPFDIIGDVHGCYDELCQLLEKLGYQKQGTFTVADTGLTVPRFRHPDGRKLIFVGDYADRGPNTPAVLAVAEEQLTSGAGYGVIGNHDEEYRKHFNPDQAPFKRGMFFNATFRQLASVVGALLGDTQLGDTLVNETHDGLKAYQHHLFKFLNTLPVQLRFDNGRLVVAHAAAPEADHGQPTSKRIRRKSLYGFQADTPDEFGLKPRTNWTNTYTGPAVVVYGHVPHQNVYANNNCYDVDTGCCFGNKLTALRYPEMNWVDVAANHIYEAYPRGALPTTWVDPETTA